MGTKYDRIGIGYDHSRRADPALTEAYIRALALAPGATVLDVGCGTGNYTLALERTGLSLIGVDPSEEMLRAARARCSAVDWRRGTAEELPVEDASVDGALATLTIHHWSDLERGFAEVRRSLKPGGRFVLFTSTPAQMRGYWLNAYFPRMLEASIAQMPDLDLVERGLSRAGLRLVSTEKYFVHEDLQDLFLYSGKHDPAKYLDPGVRRGISSFAALANREEVELGLRTLEADIASGRIREVARRYANDDGDYLLVVAEKPAATSD